MVTYFLYTNQPFAVHTKPSSRMHAAETACFLNLSPGRFKGQSTQTLERKPIGRFHMEIIGISRTRPEILEKEGENNEQKPTRFFFFLSFI